MLDKGVITVALQRRGHTVGHIFRVPANGGEYEFEVDGALLTLAEVRALMEADDVRNPLPPRPLDAPVGWPFF